MNIEQTIQAAVGVKADGIIGPKTLGALYSKFGASSIKGLQQAVGVKADGIMGQQTKEAICRALGVDMTSVVPTWPTQAEVRTGKSMFGKATSAEGQLVHITPPYQLYFEGTPVKTIRVHKLVAPYVSKVLEEVLAHYGAQRLHALHLDDFGGCYNAREVRGGSTLSMHAWGVALDWWASANPMKATTAKAPLAGPEYDFWWDTWEKYGAVSLGRANGKDWMHVQFPPLH